MKNEKVLGNVFPTRSEVNLGVCALWVRMLPHSPQRNLEHDLGPFKVWSGNTQHCITWEHVTSTEFLVPHTKPSESESAFLARSQIFAY